MGNSDSSASDEEANSDYAMEDSQNEVIKVFQPQKLRQELENGRTLDTYKLLDFNASIKN